MEIFSQTQSAILWVLTVASLGLKVYAFVDALRVPAPSYASAGKLTKNLWLIFLGVAVAVNIVMLNPINFINIIGVVAAAVYLLDVRPAVRALGGGRRDNTNEGPYGPW